VQFYSKSANQFKPNLFSVAGFLFAQQISDRSSLPFAVCRMFIHIVIPYFYAYLSSSECRQNGEPKNSNVVIKKSF